MLYDIIRYYAPGSGRENYTVKEGLTLEEAQEHCQDRDTHGPGWFDGYVRSN